MSAPDQPKRSPRRPMPIGIRLLIVVGIGIGLLILAVPVAFLVENMRGQAAWKRFKAESEARGDNLDLSGIQPPSVPDDENFAMTPFLVPLFDYDRSQPGKWRDPAGHERAVAVSSPFKRSGEVKVPTAGNWEMTVPIDLEAWKTYFEQHPDYAGLAPETNAPGVVLGCLARFDPVLGEIAAASGRAHSVFPIHYHDNFNALLPHLSVLKGLATVIQLRALASLAAGNTNAAFQDVRLGMRLADSLKNEPLLISQLVRLAIIQLTIQPVWEGLARRQWSDSQLADLQHLLAGVSALDRYEFGVRGERAMGNGLFEQLRNGGIRSNDLQAVDDSLAKSIRYLPTGWIYQNQVALNRLYELRLLPIIDARNRRAYPARAIAAEQAPELRNRTPYNIFAALLVPSLSPAAAKFAHRQSSLDLAMVACALERFRLAHGRHPERLRELSPAYIANLPPDVITGESLRYERGISERFLLYSVGWNEADDQGEVVRRGRGDALKTDEGDWVWSYGEH